MTNAVYCLNWSYDKTKSYIMMPKGHFCAIIHEHLSGKSAIHEHSSSYNDCHSYSVNKFYALAETNTDFNTKIKEALLIRNIYQN